MSGSQARLFPTRTLGFVAVALGSSSHAPARRSQPGQRWAALGSTGAARQCSGLSPRCRGHPGQPPSGWEPQGRGVAPSAWGARHTSSSDGAECGVEISRQTGTAGCTAASRTSPSALVLPLVRAARSPAAGTPAGQHPGLQPALAGTGLSCRGALSSPGGSATDPRPLARLRRISRREQGTALAAALAETLWAAGGGRTAVICLVTATVHAAPSRDCRADSFTERVGVKTPSANRSFSKDTFGLTFLKTRKVKIS